MRYRQADPKAETEKTWRAFVGAFARKYDPDQPRDEFGRWSDGNGESSSTREATDFSAARRGQSESVCWSQYTIDLLRCGSELRSAARAICRGQAMERYSACISGRTIPPLSF